MIAILSSHLSGPSAEVQVGQALQRVLLTATANGLATSFLSHIVEVPRTREELRRLIGGARPPQAVLRIGHGWPVAEVPRRPVGDLLTSDGPPRSDTRCRGKRRVANAHRQRGRHPWTSTQWRSTTRCVRALRPVALHPSRARFQRPDRISLAPVHRVPEQGGPARHPRPTSRVGTRRGPKPVKRTCTAHAWRLSGRATRHRRERVTRPLDAARSAEPVERVTSAVLTTQTTRSGRAVALRVTVANQVKALTPVMSRPTIRVWMCSVPS
ncbi:MAG: hypothetical protein QOF00_5593 [Pseudonocardiales bacterium]|nr:hypothetical protein [Pseudonocardiales bacterium]